MKISQILTNFTGGVWSPRLYGRVDISKYFNSCRTLQNMIVYPHGGASRRFGTVYVAECKYSDRDARLIPFLFSIDDAYMLEMGDEYVRFFRNGGVVVSGTSTYEIASLYSSVTLADVKYAQNADVMRLVNQAVPPSKLTRTGHINWAMSTALGASCATDWAYNDYPAAIALYEQRAVYANSPSYPQRFWFSPVSDLDTLSTGTADDDGLHLTLDDYNNILWMVSGRFLNVGTNEGEWVLSGGTIDEPITPTTRKARKISAYGSKNIQALSVNNAILFVQRVGKKLREIIYDYAQDTFGDPPDLTILAEHITSTGIKNFAFQKNPDSILWCVLEDGNLAGFTYNKNQEIIGWHLHTTDGTFEDVGVMPTATEDQVWFITERYINYQTKRFIEYLAPNYDDVQSACWFVDCGLQYSGTAATTLSGLDHLEGKEVSILSDGYVSPNTTVASGVAIIPYAAASVTIGLPYTSILEPMDLEFNQEGMAQGKRKKIHNIMIRFYKTLGAKVGTPSGTMDIIPFRTPSTPMNTVQPLFTGDKTVPFPGGWDKNSYIRITQEQPLPLTVLAIVPTVSSND